MSNISALLREAAGEVALEEKKVTEEGIAAAASELEQTLSGHPVVSPRKAAKEDDVSEDVQALLAQMSLKPKYSGNTIDDVDALINAQKRVSSEGSRASVDRYRHKKSAREVSALSSRSVASSRRTLDVQSMSTAELSRVSIMLQEADEKSWGRDIKYAFKNPQQELLFRSMKVVRPLSGAADPKNATTAPRLQRYTTCDLKLHADRRSSATVAEEKHKLRESMRMSADRLCSTMNKQPSRRELRADPTLAYSTYEDARECTFRPRIAGKARKQKKRGGGGDGDDGDEDQKGEGEDKFAFINRQEAEERNRRVELEFQMGKAKYDARVDKKTCPRCGAKQSYDEFKEKRKNCVHCNVEYCAAVSWAKVSRRFFQSNLEYSLRVAEKKQRLKEEAEAEAKYVQRTHVDPRTGKTSTYLAERKAVLTPAEELEFFDRMEEMLARRENKVRALEAKIYSEKFPFKPTVASRAHKGSKGESSEEEDELEDDEEGGGSGAVKAFLKRYQQDLEARKDKFPGKYIHARSHAEDKDLAPFRISKSIERGRELYL